jgi:hypothetical protein
MARSLSGISREGSAEVGLLTRKCVLPVDAAVLPAVGTTLVIVGVWQEETEVGVLVRRLRQSENALRVKPSFRLGRLWTPRLASSLYISTNAVSMQRYMQMKLVSAPTGTSAMNFDVRTPHSPFITTVFWSKYALQSTLAGGSCGIYSSASFVRSNASITNVTPTVPSLLTQLCIGSN